MDHRRIPQQARPIIAVGALYPTAPRGLAADLLAGQMLGRRVAPVCTALAMATANVVTDFVEVPEDAVRAQLEHLQKTTMPAAVKIGVLGEHGTARAVLEWVPQLDVPVVLDLQISGPAGETVLSRRAVDEVLARLSAPDVVLLDRFDAELIGGGEIRSLDDAQVAAQRILRRGARAVLLKAGVLPGRHFQVDVPPNGSAPRFAADLFYDGSEFMLFEAPWLDETDAAGASSLHALALAHALAQGLALAEALRESKTYVTERLRRRDWIGAATVAR
jgi:hydroxymethylpyrimidine/phosphomethylpyrimidine kinase